MVDGAADGGGGDRREEDPGGEEDGVDAGGGAEGGEQAAIRRASEKIGTSPESRNCWFLFDFSYFLIVKLNGEVSFTLCLVFNGQTY